MKGKTLAENLESIQKLREHVATYIGEIGEEKDGEFIADVDEEDFKILLSSVGLLDSALGFCMKEMKENGLLEETVILTREKGDFTGGDLKEISRS